MLKTNQPDKLTPTQQIRVIKFLKKLYEDTETPHVKQNTLYTILFASVLSDSADDVQWALDKGANPATPMSSIVESVLKNFNFV